MNLREVLAAIDTTRGPLPGKVHRAALSHGMDIAPGLLAMLDPMTSPRRGGGHGAIHAIRLLGQIKVYTAIPALVGVLWTALEDGAPRARAAVNALSGLGRPAMDALVDAGEGSEVFEALRAEALALLQVHDPRALALLLRFVEREPAIGAALVSVYGDPGAIPSLNEVLARLDADAPRARITARYLIVGIERLGGQVGPSQRLRFDLD